MILRLLVLSIGIGIMLLSCTSSVSSTDEPTALPSTPTVSNQQNIFQDNLKSTVKTNKQVFPWVLDSTFYNNPEELLQQLGIFYGQEQTSPTTITAFERQQLYGLKDSVWFVNCSSMTSTDSSCLYPTTNTQYIFDHQGYLIHKDQAAMAQFIPAVLDSMPLYMTIQHDCMGNGQHHFYMYQQGALIDIFNVLMDNTPKTYDANPDEGMFYNKHLKVFIQDNNKDGYPDIVLKGKWLVLENQKGQKYSPSRPFKIQTIQYPFIYKPTKEYFLLEQ